MDFDTLKNKWQSLTVDPETLERDTRRIATELSLGKITGAQQRLARYHRSSGLKGLFPYCYQKSIFIRSKAEKH